MEGEVSLPSNYVTIQQLKERWLQQNHQISPKPNADQLKPDSHLNSTPNDDAALKSVPQRSPDRRGVIKPEVVADDSDSGFKTQVDDPDNHRPKGNREKKEHSNSKPRYKKKSGRGQKPRVVTEQKSNGNGTTPLVEPETVMDKIQTQQLGVRQSGNQNGVWQPKAKLPPLAHNDARGRSRGHGHRQGHGGVHDVAIAADVTVINVGGWRYRRGSERTQVKPEPKLGKPPIGITEGQTSFVWVKKGESSAN